MGADWRKVGAGAVLAGVLLFVLARISGFGLSDLQGLSYRFALFSVAFSMLTLWLRALNYRLIAGDVVAGTIGNWLDTGLRHQALFTLIPSGLGDLGFPFLAWRHAGVEPARGFAIIGMARLRDLLVLGALAALGLVLSERSVGLASLAILLLYVAAYKAEDLAAPLGALLTRVGINRFRGCGMAQSPNFKARIQRTLCSTAIWLSATAALWCAYRTVGVPLNASEAMLLLAGLNLVGVVAITVGGLGIAEVGSAAVLVWVGFNLDEAVRLSLVARPVLLCSVLISCLLWWVLRLNGSRLDVDR